MGIREEIEKLRLSPWREIAGTLYYREQDKAYNEVLDDALSILDEWELVAGAKWLSVYDQDQLEDGRDWILLEMNMPEESLEGIHKVKPGDHIAIYRRKKNESSS